MAATGATQRLIQEYRTRLFVIMGLNSAAWPARPSLLRAPRGEHHGALLRHLAAQHQQRVEHLHPVHQQLPNQGHGNIHFPVNGQSDY